MKRFATKMFLSHYDPTIGTELVVQTIDVGGKRIKLQVWDTVRRFGAGLEHDDGSGVYGDHLQWWIEDRVCQCASPAPQAGQEHYDSVVRSHFHGTTGVLLVYDVTKPLSFRRLAHWWQKLQEAKVPRVKAIVVGNKCDLETQRRVSHDEGRAFAIELGFLFIEVSAKTGDRVDDAFVELANEVCASMERGEYDGELAVYGIKRGYHPDRDGIPDERGKRVPIRRDSKVDGTSSESKKVEGGCC